MPVSAPATRNGHKIMPEPAIRGYPVPAGTPVYPQMGAGRPGESGASTVPGRRKGDGGGVRSRGGDGGVRAWRPEGLHRRQGGRWRRPHGGEDWNWRRRRCPHPAGRSRRRHHPYPSREEGSGARTQQGGGEGDGGTSWAEEEPRGWRAAHAGAWKGAAAGPPGRRRQGEEGSGARTQPGRRKRWRH